MANNIFRWAFGLVASFIMIQLVLGSFFNRFIEKRALSPSQILGPPHVPLDPSLQVHPSEDLVRYLRGEQELLSSYGWVDKKEGRVRVPIHRAMELLVLRSDQEDGP